MKTYVSKYELWNALFMTPDNEKTDNIKELQNIIEKSISKPGLIWIDIREEE